MSALTIRLSDNLIHEINSRAKKMHISRSEYIRKSIKNMNESIYKKERKIKIQNISERVKKESMIINAEFSKIEYE